MKKGHRARKFHNPERQIIEQFRNAFPTHHLRGAIHGIGDDASVTVLGDGRMSVVSKDLLIEDTHFKLKWSRPEDIAIKSIHANLSDLAAMGATPRYCWIGLGVPPQNTGRWIRRFSSTLSRECKKQGVAILGGDTCESKHGMLISVTVEGVARREQLRFRSGFRVGDAILIVGNSGDSALGYQILQRQPRARSFFVRKHLRPHAKIREGIWLGRRKEVRSMTDLSDGLLAQLENDFLGSGFGACIELSDIRVSTGFYAQCRKFGIDSSRLILQGGEDYNLLLTCRPQQVAQLLRKFRQMSRESVAVVGRVTGEPKIDLVMNGVSLRKPLPIYRHFDSAHGDIS